MNVHFTAMFYMPFESGYLYLMGVENINYSNNLNSL